MFNDYFVDIGRSIAESIGGSTANHLDYMTHINQPNSFFFRPVHCYSTEKLICSLKNMSSNLNTIPVNFLKSICDIISPCLTNIINRSLTTGVFPDSLKKARVTTMPKEGDKCNLSNYRPISVLPVFSKVFEKVACMHSCMITWKITRSCINNNMDFVLKSLLLRPFCNSCSTCISI